MPHRGGLLRGGGRRLRLGGRCGAFTGAALDRVCLGARTNERLVTGFRLGCFGSTGISAGCGGGGGASTFAAARHGDNGGAHLHRIAFSSEQLLHGAFIR